MVDHLTVFRGKSIEDGDNHDRNFDNEKNGDDKDQHSCNSQRVYHLSLPLIVLEAKNVDKGKSKLE